MKNENIELCDSNGVLRILIGLLGESEIPSLSFHDKNGLNRLVISLHESGEGVISFHDTSGELRLGLGVSPDLGAGITILNHKGNLPSININTNGPSGQILITNNKGETVFDSALVQLCCACPKAVLPRQNAASNDQTEEN